MESAHQSTLRMFKLGILRRMYRLLQRIRTQQRSLRLICRQWTNRCRMCQLGLGQPEMSEMLIQMDLQQRWSLHTSQRRMFKLGILRRMYRLLQRIRTQQRSLRLICRQWTNRCRMCQLGLGQPEMSEMLIQMDLQQRRSLYSSKLRMFKLGILWRMYRLLQRIRTQQRSLRLICRQWTNRCRMCQLGLGQPEMSEMLIQMDLQQRRSLHTS
jgi:hypothetical protein